ncbi:MAG: hypothetical protein JO332_04280, partial [Planctomycetaceae bacterium]|nr:hypothetical protein [Planctomycetaceae bacterium]
TPEYASPEQIQGDPLDARTDIYSLGATLYHFLAGHPPFPGKDVEEITRKVLKEDPPRLKDVPASLVRIVRKAMARERDRRYGKVDDLARDLESWIDRSRPGFHLRPLWVGVAVLVLVLSWGTTFIILRHSQSQDDRQRVLEALRDGDRNLAKAERSLSDAEDAVRGEQEARAALADYSLALRWSGDRDPEARHGMGRCFELLGEDGKAEESFREAGDLAAARSALVWLWARRLVEGRNEREARDYLAKNADARHVARLFAEGKWEAVLAAHSQDRSDGVPVLLRAKAALELGRGKEALGTIEAGLRRRPREATLHYLRGIALSGQGNASGAAAAWREALRVASKDWPLRDEVRQRIGDVEK